MAVRRPVYADSNGNLKEMTDSHISAIKLRAKRLYMQSPSVTLSVVSSGGDLGTIYDTRLQAGAGKTSVSAFPSEASTGEPSVVSVGYSRLDQNVASVSNITDSGSTFPLYFDGSNLKHMSRTDFYDTFIYGAISDVADETYYIHNSSTLSGWSRVSSTVVFSDTGANTGLYTAAGIYETRDQPYTRQNFYLFRKNAVSATVSTFPARYVSSNISVYSSGDLDGLLLDGMRYSAASISGHRIRFSWNGDGTNRGAAWDDRLNGSGNYQTRKVNADDYRAQEFPNGSFVRISTYYLRVRVV
jgi:hypothetical protein